MVKISINISKYGEPTIDKNGNKWINVSGYLKEEKDKFGNNGFVKKVTSKDEAKDAPIIGNFSVITGSSNTTPANANKVAEMPTLKPNLPSMAMDQDNDLPF